MPAIPEALEAILARLTAVGQPVEKIVLYLRRPSDGRGRPNHDIVMIDEDDQDYRDLHTAIVNASNAIVRANFNDGLSEEDMDLSHALGVMGEFIIGLHARRDRQTIENMFDTAKKSILASDFFLSLPDAIAKIPRLGTILDIHLALACYQVDTPQPEEIQRS